MLVRCRRLLRTIGGALFLIATSCEKTTVVVVSPPNEYSLATLALRAGGSDRARIAVLTDRARALDSLYALRFGNSQALPLPEEQVVQAVERAITSNALLGATSDTNRVMRELRLTAAEVAANAQAIVELYRRIAAYDVYVDLVRPVTQGLSLPSGSPTILNPAEAYLVATHPWLMACTVSAIADQYVSAREYYVTGGGQVLDGLYDIDATRANAYQHALWNMILVKYCGYLQFSVDEAVKWAKDFTDAHEFGGEDAVTTIDSEMDLHNNAVGRDVIRPLAFLVNNGLLKTVDAPPIADLRTLIAARADRALFVRTVSQMFGRAADLVFLRPPLSVKLAGNGTGVVKSPYGSIDCELRNTGQISGRCAYDVKRGQVFELAATAGAGSSFVGWTGDCIGNSCTISDDRPRTVVATFSEVPSYSIAVISSPSDGGSTTGSGLYPAGSPVTLSAIARSGFAFSRWTESGNQVSTNNPLQFTATSSRSFVAVFTQSLPAVYSISVSASPPGGGTVSGNGNYPANANVVVTATPANGYSFARWTDGGVQISTSASYSFAATANRTLVAVFNQTGSTTHTVGVSAFPSNAGSVSGSGTYSANTSVTVTANPNTGYAFTNWIENGQVVSTTQSYSFTITSSRSLVANFNPASATYTIATSSNPSNGGSTSGGGAKNANASVTVSAAPASGYSFMHWTENGQVVSTNQNYSFIATANRALLAHFNAVTTTYTVTTSCNPSIGGSTSGSGVKNANSAVTVTAVAASGYSFVNWTEGALVVSTNPAYSFTVIANRNLAANFNQIGGTTYVVSVSASPSHGGGVSGNGTYAASSLVIVTASPAAGYAFQRWTESGQQVSATPTYSFAVTANRSLVAKFGQTTSPLAITSTTLNPPTATVGVPYAAQQAVAATGGQTPYTWSATGLPSGLAINSSTGAVYGTPSASGAFSPTVTVRDASSPQQTASRSFALTVSSGTIPPRAPSGLAAYGTALLVSLAWNDNSTNETGFIIERAPGTSTSFNQIGITGQNIASYLDQAVALGSTYTYRVRAYNSGGSSSASASQSATVIPDRPVLISPGSLSSPGPIITTLSPTMTWNAVSGATNYNVAIRDLITNQLVVNVQIGNATALYLPANTLVVGHDYRWDVQGVRNGVAGQYAIDFYFRVR